MSSGSVLTLLPVAWCRGVGHLDTVSVSGLQPSSTEDTGVDQLPVLLAEEGGDETLSPVCGPPHIPERVHTYADRYTHTNTDEHTQICRYSRTPHTDTHIHTHSHTDTHAQIYIHSHAHIDARVQTDTGVHTDIHTE